MVALMGEGGLLTGSVNRCCGGPEVEIIDHLGYEPDAIDGRGSDISS